MFTYREFADGAHRFRQGIMRDKEDISYEIARSENELAVIKSSQITDPGALAKILSRVSDLFAEAGREGLHYERYASISALFTYYKLIAQYCELAITQLESIYRQPLQYYALSTGGLIYKLIPDPYYEMQLPQIRAKIPVTDAPGRVRPIIHEAFVAMVALNPLRRFIPTFSYMYSYWECGSFIDILYSKTPAGGLCSTSGTRPVMIYESNTSAEPLSSNVEYDLPDVLNFLLQLMGALQMAHTYADYTHYDLHQGNILLQDLAKPISIAYQEYEILTDTRIIIIDNGLAYCRYQRKKGPNSTSVEIFEEDERLRSTKITSYGSIQNRILGVSHERSYPLGDIFRVFFDLFATCTRDVKQELLPLVSVFFKDPIVAEKMINRTHDPGSSMINRVALPPFKEELYNYRYIDFASEILRLFPEVTSSFAKVRSASVIVPPTRLSEIVNWQERNPNYVPSLFEIGVTALLDRTQASTLTGMMKKSQAESLNQLASFRNLLLGTLEEQEWRDLSIPEHKISAILDRDFFLAYMYNIRHPVNSVQLVRIVYSNARVYRIALEVRGNKNSSQILAGILEVDVDDLHSLSAFCNRFPLSTQMKRKVKHMSQVTERIEDIVKSYPQKRITEENVMINWYKACLPAVRNHLDFCLQWGNIDASFGELSLPDAGNI